jgi:hypothetical protein
MATWWPYSSEQVGRARPERHLVVGCCRPLLLEVFEEPGALAEALGVPDLVVHRPFGDVGHLVGDALPPAQQHRHLRVRERPVEVERDQLHTRPSGRADLKPHGSVPPRRSPAEPRPPVRPLDGAGDP